MLSLLGKLFKLFEPHFLYYKVGIYTNRVIVRFK